MNDLIVDIVRSGGAWTVGVLMLVENVFPPIPSEVIMPLGGYLAATGALDFWTVVAMGALGSLSGAVLWYLVGRHVGRQGMSDWAGRHGAWVAMTPDDIEKAQGWFDRHGGASVFFCRLIPFVRSVISVPAGMSGMPPTRFVLYSAAGTLLWVLALAWAGRLLGQRFTQVGDVVGWATWVVIGAALVWYVWRVIRLHRAH